MSRAQHLIPLETIHRRIFVIRHHNVMLDQDLAALYGVGTKVLHQVVNRNMEPPVPSKKRPIGYIIHEDDA